MVWKGENKMIFLTCVPQQRNAKIWQRGNRNIKKAHQCKFVGNCKYFDCQSNTCNLTKGFYYSPKRPAGCYRDREEIEQLNKDIKLLIISEIKDGIDHGSIIKIMEKRIQELNND